MNLETGLSVWVCDSDLVSMYPSVMRALNTSRMTMTFAPFKIDGMKQDAVRRYFSNLVNVRENAELLCSEFCGLPNYSEMAKLVLDELINKQSLGGDKNE